MKKILIFFCFWVCQYQNHAETTVDINLTSTAPNTLEVYLTASAAVSISEVTFTIKQSTACGALLSSPINMTPPGFNFTKVGTFTGGGFTYTAFAATPNSPYISVTGTTKVMSLTVTGSSGICSFFIEDNAVDLPNGTFNIVNGSGMSINRNIGNSANGVVLPVELLSFTAEKKEASSLIKWESIGDKNLAYYVVERSVDGINFKSIGFEKPRAKNADEKVFYTFSDEKPELGINYYRLQIKDLNEKSITSKVVSIDFGSKIKAKTYPNPFSTELSIEIDIEKNIKGDVTIDLFDAAGKQILTQKVAAQGRRLNINLPTEDLVPGSYVIRMKNGNDTWQQKITKQ